MVKLFFRLAGAAGAVALMAGTAHAAGNVVRAQTRLRHCGADTCLLVTGRRLDAGDPVAVSGHDVLADGGRAWRVTLPLSTVRRWVAPAARAIAVRVGGHSDADEVARLPIGLLGHTTELAALDVHAR